MLWTVLRCTEEKCPDRESNQGPHNTGVWQEELNYPEELSYPGNEIRLITTYIIFLYEAALFT
jgi:hypothetical protein